MDKVKQTACNGPEITGTQKHLVTKAGEGQNQEGVKTCKLIQRGKAEKSQCRQKVRHAQNEGSGSG